MNGIKKLLEIHDDRLTPYERQKVRLLNKISYYCILFALLFDLSYIILQRYPQMMIVTGGILFIFIPTILIQKKGHYLLARTYFSTLLLVIITATCIYNVNQGEHLQSENMLLALAPMFVILFERKLKLFLYYLTMVIFFMVRVHDQLAREETLDKLFFSSSMIYLVVFLGIYYFVDSYKRAFFRIYLNQNLLIDQLADQKKKLEQTNATKNKLFSIVAHDLKRPMHMLTGILQLDDVIPEQELREYRKQVAENVVGINSMIENVLTWAKSQLEGFQVQMQQIQLSDLLNSEMEVYRGQAKQKGIELNVDIPKGLALQSDPNHISLVFRNIVNNCIKFTPSDGSISIIASDTKNHIHVIVQDSGIGMDQETINLIEKGELIASKSGTEGEPGSGLGLILCMDTLKKIGGKLIVSSTEGEGSQFTIQLPIN